MGNFISYIKSANRFLFFILSLFVLLFIASFSFVRAQANDINQASPQGTIIKGGILSADETWTSDIIYVITPTLTVNPSVTLTIQANTIIKIFRDSSHSDIYMDVQGTLNLQGSLGSEVKFTSYRDDVYGGDTNGDGNNTTPAPEDWDGIHLHNNSTTFQYAIVRYSTNGLAVWNDQATDIQPVIFHNTFEQNIHGVSLFIQNDNNITSQIQNNVFTHNYYGLYTSDVLSNGHETCNQTAMGTSLPVLQNNEFNNNSQLPIYLNGSAFPTYSENTFIGYPTPDQRLGIGLGCHFNYSGEWLVVNSSADGSGINMPYVVVENTTIDSGTTITVPPTTIIKFDLSKWMDVQGTLNLQSSSSETIITFTSFRDDIGGDTNGDGSDTEPIPGDWDGLYLKNSSTIVQYVTLRYSSNGLAVWNLTSNEINPSITDSTFYKNINGIQLHLESTGNITSLIQNNQVSENQYGLITTRITGATGTSRPAIISNNFNSNMRLPIYLAGSAFPSYTGNTFSGYPAADQRLGIGLSGSFTQSGTWFIVNNMPYVVLGNTTITANNIVTLPGNMIVKLDTNTYLDVKGSMSLQSDLPSPIHFTSIKDDMGGDTNGDRSGTLPAPGDWNTIYLENANTVFAYTTVKYGAFGLTIYNASSETFDLAINNNAFSFNKTGVYFRSCSNGVNQGTFADNSITNTAGFPIVLNGTAFPGYQNNTFSGNLYPAIALTSDWYASGIWPDVMGDQGQVFPYVIIKEKKCDNQTPIGGVRITANTEITTMSGAVLKFDTGTWMDVLGTLTMQSTLANPIIFTSYLDDSYKGDTNGDGESTQPALGDWEAIYLETSTTNFHNAVVKYASRGLNVYNTNDYDIYPTIQDSYFEENEYGVILQTAHRGNINSAISNNQFITNTYGLATLADTGNPFFALVGGAYPQLSNNTFSGCSGFPIYLNGTAEPVYSGNFFTNNTHPAIALGGFWNANVTWVKVIGDNYLVFPYVVDQTIIQDRGNDPFNPVTITLPEGLILKFNLDTYLYAYGLLNLQSTVLNPIILTSYLDDSYAGDTNADDGTTLPGMADWKTVWLLDATDKRNDVHDIIAKYATAAIGVYYDGPANTQIDTIIKDSTFSENNVGVVLAIGWQDPKVCVPCQGEGNIISPITNVNFDDNLYGLATYAHSKSTGYSAPTLINVEFNRTLEYPIFLGGTSFPIFESGNRITGSPKYGESIADNTQPSILEGLPASLDIRIIVSPGIQAQRAANLEASIQHPVTQQPATPASGGLVVSSSLIPAIGLGGVFNNTGTLYQADVTYAVTGGYPLLISINNISDPVNPNLVIGTQNPQSSSVTMLANTVVKIGPGLYIDVKGKLDLQGTLDQPVIFTSIKDDSVGGDTNRDGGSSFPAKGDWQALYLESSYTNFSNAVVKYTSGGLYIYFNGKVNENINPMVSGSIFTSNTTGLTMWAAGAGDILSEIHHNLFINNDTDILGHLNVDGNSQPSSGRLLVNIHDNDLLGPTSYGVNNLSTNWTILAQNNYWGDPSGPQHISNPGGIGVPVSNRVYFFPWLTGPSFIKTYSVLGQVISNDEIPVGILGVTINLSNGMTTVTNAGGYFSFSNLNPGNYGVSAVLSGYKFTPQSYAVSVPPDATGTVIIGELSTQPTYSISGKVLELQNLPIEGVIITLNTGGNTVTDMSGKYIISDLAVGTYIITPILESYTFTPPSRTVTLGPDRFNQNFVLNAKIGTPKTVFLPLVRR